MFGLTPEEEKIFRKTKSLDRCFRILEFALRPEGTTAEEACDALQIPKASFDPRFHELIDAGCFVIDGKRPTRSGSAGRVFKTKPTVSFKAFLASRSANKLVKHVEGLSDVESTLLAVGMKAYDVWTSAQSTEKKRENALIAIAKTLGTLAHRAKQPPEPLPVTVVSNPKTPSKKVKAS